MIKYFWYNILDWWVYNRLSRHFRECEKKYIESSSRHNVRLLDKVDIRYKEIEIKQRKNINFLGLIETMSGKLIDLRATEKINLPTETSRINIWNGTSNRSILFEKSVTENIVCLTLVLLLCSRIRERIVKTGIPSPILPSL